MSDYQRALDTIRRSVSIVDLIGETVHLKKKGKEHEGLCPFHEENTPSFHVNEDKGVYICRSCGTGGDIFNWVEFKERVQFHEAARILAKRSNVLIPTPNGMSDDEYAKHQALQSKCFEATRWAASWFADQLMLRENATPRDYLRQRGVKLGAVRAFAIGYAPENPKTFLDAFGAAGFSEETGISSGILKRYDDGRVLPMFRGRVVFPIRDRKGDIVSFGGRALREDQKPKYINGPETVLYEKGLHLYNVDRAEAEIKKAGYAVLVEGFMDVVLAVQDGVLNAVGCLGTALTEQQCRLLKRGTDKLLFLFDPDEAGKNAVIKGASVAIGAGLYPRVCVLPNGYDPGSIVASGAHLSTYMQGQEDIVTFATRHLLASFDVSSVEGKTKFLHAISPIACASKDTVAREANIDAVASVSGLSHEFIRGALAGQVEPPRQIRVEPKDEDWIAPSPIGDETAKLPDFPVHTLPDPLSRFVWECAAQFEVPEDLPAFVVLSLLSYAFGPKISVEAWPGYVEDPCVLYLVIGMAVGETKTPTYKACMAPFYGFLEQINQNRRKYDVQIEATESIIETRKKELKNKPNDPIVQDSLVRAMSELDKLKEERPGDPIAEDITSEKLGIKVAENNGAMLVTSDEGDLFEIINGKYSSGVPTLGIFLKGNSGAFYTVDRVSRSSLIIKRLCLTLMQVVQPSVIRGMARREENKDKGFLARFMYSLPKSLVGFRQFDTQPISNITNARYYDWMLSALATPWGTEGPDKKKVPYRLRLSPEASECFRAVKIKIERQLRNKGSMYSVVDWGNKSGGYFLRLAGLLHCCHHNGKKFWEIPISLETFQSALEIGRYATQHTKAAYELMGAETTDETQDATEILEWAKQRTEPTFTKRDVTNSLRKRLKGDRISKALAALEEHGYIEIDGSLDGRGRGKKAVIRLNPKAVGQNEQRHT